MSQDKATELLTRWNGLKAERINWDVLWQDVANYIIPRKGQILVKTAPGQEQTVNIYDTTAAEALGIGAAGMVTHICPAGEKWSRFAAKDEDSSEDQKQWWDEVSDVVTSLINSSNFNLTIHEDCIDDLGFGSSLMLLEKGKKKFLNFIGVPVGTFAWDEDAEGNIDTVGREWKWSARQAAQKWGKDKLGKQQTEALNNPLTAGRQFTYLHFVEPREIDYDGGPVAGKLRPIASYYLCVEDQQVIEEDGYYTMPYFGSRLLRSNNEKYGRGPGTEAMPEIKLLNSMERDILVAVEKMVNPGWLKPDDAAYQMDNRPGGENFWDTSNAANKPEQIEYKNQIDLGEQKTEQKRQRVRRAFFNDLFQMLTAAAEQKREKTAYEVQQMVAEKLLLFSPLFYRFASEKLEPCLIRIFDMCYRESVPMWQQGKAGIFPIPPEGMDGADYEIIFTSKIALAIKAAENQAFATMMTLIAQASALDPAVVNLLDVMGGCRRVGRNIGIPAKLMRSDRDVQKRTQAQMQAQMAQQQAETAETASKVVKNLGPMAAQQATRKILAGAQS